MISLAQEHLKKMKESGQVVLLNSDEDLARSKEFDIKMAKIRQDFKVKERESLVSASKVFFTH